MFACMCVCLSVFLFVCLSVCLCVCLSVCLLVTNSTQGENDVVEGTRQTERDNYLPPKGNMVSLWVGFCMYNQISSLLSCLCGAVDQLLADSH